MVLLGMLCGVESCDGGLFVYWIPCLNCAGLAGATADVHSYDVMSNKWSR